MIEVIAGPTEAEDGLAIIDRGGAVWRTFERPWWDVSSWPWWWLMPGEKKWVQLRKATEKVRVRAVLVSGRHVRIG